MPVEYLFSTALIGVLTSVATEAVKWVNGKLSGTVLEGDGALLLSIGLAFLAALIKGLTVGVPVSDFWSWSGLVAYSATIFGWSTLYFKTIATWFGLKAQ